VPRLLGPLLTVDDMQLVKAYYRRPLRQGGAHSHETRASAHLSAASRAGSDGAPDGRPGSAPSHEPKGAKPPRTKLMPSSVSTLRVRYAETDKMGVVYYANYLVWFEVGRTDLLRARGCTYRELEQQGLRLPVIEARAEYIRPVLYDDLLEIRTRLVALSGARMSFTYEVHRSGSPGALATGFTAHASIDAEGRPRRLPADLRQRLS